MRSAQSRRQWWWYVVYLLCLCVFLLSLNAKTSLYQSTGTAHVNPSAVSKLWANGAKMEIRSVAAFAALLWLSALILFALSLCQAATRRFVPKFSPPRYSVVQFRPFWFLRPPPALLF